MSKKMDESDDANLQEIEVIKFEFQPPDLTKLELKDAVKIIKRIGNNDLFNKAKETYKFKAVRQILQNVDFMTANKTTLDKLKDIFYLEDDEEVELSLLNQIREKYKKEKKKISAPNARRIAIGDIIMQRHLELIEKLDDENEKLSILDELNSQINGADSVIFSKGNQKKALSKDEKAKENAAEDFQLGQLSLEDLKLIIGDDEKDKSQKIIDAFNKLEKTQTDKLLDGENWRGVSRANKNFKKSKKSKSRSSNEEKFVPVGKDSKIMNVIKNSKDGINVKLDEENNNVNNIQNNVSRNYSRNNRNIRRIPRSEIMNDEIRNKKLQDIKTRRESKINNIDNAFDNIKKKLGQIKQFVHCIIGKNPNVACSLQHEKNPNTWDELSKAKFTGSRELLGRFCRDIKSSLQVKGDFSQVPDLLWTADIFSAMSKEIENIVIVMSQIVEYLDSLDKLKTDLAKYGDNSYKIQNRAIIKTNFINNNNQYIKQEDWDKLTPLEKINKTFKFSDRTQNPPNYLFKRLEPKDKEEFYQKRKEWRKQRYMEMYESYQKGEYVEVAYMFDNFYHYAMRDKYGFKLSVPQGGLLGEYADDEEDIAIRRVLEDCWLDQGRRKRIFNVVFVNRRKVFTYGQCSKFVIGNRRRYNLYNRNRSNNLPQVMGRFSGFKRRRNNFGNRVPVMPYAQNFNQGSFANNNNINNNINGSNIISNSIPRFNAKDYNINNNDKNVNNIMNNDINNMNYVPSFNYDGLYSSKMPPLNQNYKNMDDDDDKFDGNNVEVNTNNNKNEDF